MYMKGFMYNLRITKRNPLLCGKRTGVINYNPGAPGLGTVGPSTSYDWYWNVYS